MFSEKFEISEKKERNLGGRSGWKVEGGRKNFDFSESRKNIKQKIVKIECLKTELN